MSVSVKKIFILGAISIIGLAAALFAVWYLINLRDEKLSEGFNEFFFKDEISESENGLFAFYGLSAPIGKDIYRYGKDLFYKKITYEDADKEKIDFKGDHKSLKCWRTQNGKKEALENNELCAKKEDILKMLKDNQLLVKRYNSLRNYSRFADYDIGGYNNGGLLIQINVLLLANMAVEKDGAKALKTWVDNIKYIQKVVSDKQTMVGKSIFLALYNMNINFLPVLIEKHPNLLKKKNHLDQINQVLSAPAFGKDGWNIASTMRAEYEIIKLLNKEVDSRFSKPLKNTFLFLRGFSFYKPNATKNKFFELSKDMVWLSEQTASSFKNGKHKLDSKYSYDKNKLTVYLYNSIGKFIIYGMYSGGDLILSMHSIKSRMVMLKLYIDAKKQGITKENMRDFIEKSDKAYYNPLTDKPFEWDKKSGSIYFTITDSVGRSTRHEAVY